MARRFLTRKLGAGLAAGALTVAGLAVFSSAAFASSSTANFTAHCDPSSPTCPVPFNPALTGPPPPFVTIPSNCPSFLSTDAWTLLRRWELRFPRHDQQQRGLGNRN